MDKLIIGSHVGMNAPEYYLGAVKEALGYGSTTFMFYTGAPQNSFRKPVEALKIEEGKALVATSDIIAEQIVVHAPYIINLGNTVNSETFEMAIRFLITELRRVAAFGARLLVLHPGAHVGAGDEAGLAKIVEGLDTVLAQDGTNVTICLETMAGKGTELGRTFEQIRYFIDHCAAPKRLGVCMDTCHINDAGYNVHDVDGVLNEFDRIVGLDKLKILHVNDSKNVRGAQKDRHENLGYGEIGFETLNRYVHHPRLAGIPKILETPWIGDRPPYKEEISMLKKQKLIPGWKDTF
ncbi:MAG TPA: deoxyribonuclease IV [Firmicutes bacterium]|jgi:deoxyribonuclease-4|nr:deoxyribonuclease IV [Bacillota bacterium]